MSIYKRYEELHEAALNNLPDNPTGLLVFSKDKKFERYYKYSRKGRVYCAVPGDITILDAIERAVAQYYINGKDVNDLKVVWFTKFRKPFDQNVNFAMKNLHVSGEEKDKIESMWKRDTYVS